MGRKGSDYVPEAAIPPGYLARYEMAVSALYGAIPVAEAARRLGISRMRFQTILHRAQRAFAEELLPKPAGRPARSEREAELEERVRRLEKENAQLREQVELAENLMASAGQMMRSLRSGRRRPRAISVPAALQTTQRDDPEPRATSCPSSRPRWRRWSAMMTERIRPRSSARRWAWVVMGISAGTLRRWTRDGDRTQDWMKWLASAATR
jgi:molybdenum-dependent DNA-binding transcriptional regulator ModE